ncbi:hypothetical protein KRP22_005785 [Phytophthora ramorum]|nr:hypothetical protein KRP22_3083 [Phytophthora ramorum]
MAIYGASTFDVYIKPMLNGSNVSFQGKATFEQDGVVHSFYLIDDSAYHQVVDGSIDTTTCLPADSIPSVSDIVEAIASATAISSVNTDQDISCTNGTWLSTTFSGESYVLCTGSDINENNFTVYGEDLSVTFEYLSEDVTITKPKSAPIDCEGAQDNSVELSSLGQVYGISLSGSHRALKEEAGAVHLASSTCACQGGLVIPHHSSKNDGIVEFQSCVGDLDASKFDTTYASTCDRIEEDLVPASASRIANHSACSPSVIKASACGISSPGWLSPGCIHSFCNFLGGAQDSVSQMKAARALATVAAALVGFDAVAATSSLPSIKLGFSIQRSTMEVYGSSSFDVYVKPVLHGSNVTFDGKVTFEQDGTTHNLYVVDSVPYHQVINSTADSTTCLPTELFPSVPDIVEAIASATAVSTVSTDQDISCNNGTWLSATFAGESEYLGLLAGGLLIPHHSSKNDGIVEFQSCIGNLDSASFETTYSTTWYAAALNHADTTFHNGEAGNSGLDNCRNLCFA